MKYIKTKIYDCYRVTNLIKYIDLIRCKYDKILDKNSEIHIILRRKIIFADTFKSLIALSNIINHENFN